MASGSGSGDGDKSLVEEVVVVPPSKAKEREYQIKNQQCLADLHGPPAPFPHRLQLLAKDAQNREALELFKRVSVNIPLLSAIKQISSYAKFLKDMCTVKRRLNVKRKVFLTE